MEFTLTAGPHAGIRAGSATVSTPDDLELSGITLQRGPDGTLRVGIDRLRLRLLRVQAGDIALSIAQATLSGVAAELVAGERSSQLLGLRVDEVHLQGVHLAASAAATTVRPRLTGPWRLDALRGLQGVLHAFVTDAAWVLDAEIDTPIVDGRIDFNRVVVEHLGPNSTMGISRNGIHVDSPNMGRTDLFVFTMPQVPGVTVEQRGRQRGSLDLAAFVQAVLEAPPDQPVGRVAGHQIAGSLDRTRLDGELQLGDGALGTQRQHLMLDGRARGHNRIVLSAAVLGDRLVIRMPSLSASEAVFEFAGQAGRSGAVSAVLELQAAGLQRSPGEAPASLTLGLDEIIVRQVVLGVAQPPATTPAPR
ncbi:MAG TPA: hypothetical protein VGP22_17350 [Albitalea sp.]|nr:hypothetical protein [Albitalea sp.]